MVFSIFITPIAIMISSTMFIGLRYSQSWSAVRLLFRRQHSGHVSVIIISWSYSQSHQPLATFICLVDHDPASLAKRGSCTSHPWT